MDEQSYLASITDFYQSALQWSTPPGAGATPTLNTAINTGTAFDTQGAQAQTLGANSGGWFSALQGSFAGNYAFLNSQFQASQQFLAPMGNRIVDSTDSLNRANRYALKKLAKRAGKRGLMSKLFG